MCAKTGCASGGNCIVIGFSAPNQSSAENKTNLGLAQPDGGSVNPNNVVDPENKGFYENLPFHGMQNPPNKVS